MMQAYAREVDEHKKTLLLVNKADLLPYSVRLVGSLSFSTAPHLFYVHPTKIFRCMLLSAERSGQNIFMIKILALHFGLLNLLLQL